MPLTLLIIVYAIKVCILIEQFVLSIHCFIVFAKCMVCFMTMFQMTHIFDNMATVVFAMFMSIWATLLLEGWKRYLAELSWKWDMLEYHFSEVFIATHLSECLIFDD